MTFLMNYHPTTTTIIAALLVLLLPPSGATPVSPERATILTSREHRQNAVRRFHLGRHLSAPISGGAGGGGSDGPADNFDFGPSEDERLARNQMRLGRATDEHRKVRYDMMMIDWRNQIDSL